jgi:hypothetical protein
MTSENHGFEPPPRYSAWARAYHARPYLFWVLGLVALVLLVYAEEDLRGYLSWQRYKSQMSARGETFDPAALIPPRVADDQNFAMTPALAPLFDFEPGTQHWRDTNAPRVFQDLTAKYDAAANLARSKSGERVNSWVRPRTDLSVWAAAFAEGPDAKPSEVQPTAGGGFNLRNRTLATDLETRQAATRVLAELSDFTPVLDEFRTASARPHSRFNLRYEEENPAAIVLPHLAKLKYFCQVLPLRASAYLALARTEDAWRDLELIFFLANATRDEPILISQLVRMAEVQFALQPLAEGMGQWSEPQLRALQESLQKLDFFVDTRRALQSERVLLGDGVIEYVRRSPNKMRVVESLQGSTPNGETSGIWPAGAFYAVAPGGWLYLEQLNFNRAYFQVFLPLLDSTKRQIRPEAVLTAEDSARRLASERLATRLRKHEFFSGLLLPSIPRVFQKTAYTQTAADTASIACAIERYRLAHGQIPASLDKLTPALLASIPNDIISGQPLLYRPEAGGRYVLYSVGWNEKDDGGEVQRKKKGDPDPHEGDWVWAPD